MQLTRQADYAVRVVLSLAGTAPGSVVPTARIAKRQLIPRPYLSKTVQVLARAGLVQTLRGKGGGVRLVRDPATITLRAVIEAVEGPIHLNRCLIRPGECPLERVCPVHGVWRHVQEVMMRELDAVTFADLSR